ncbi:transglycosylase [Conoideocrella luteorostrata]|uniref:chitinase n=1 Tax=Conoideocrella luteorostrata TaxID=1105319 RepID=A0AAJ0CP92_9HYPO|nr:transglycosylase [Conoideocrella luteorostrata]
MEQMQSPPEQYVCSVPEYLHLPFRVPSLLTDPQTAQCTPNTALGMTVNVDFRKGAVNSFAASGSPSYNKDGISFTVARGGDAPQLQSLFYIMFGRVEITMKAAPGAGIVSSLVLESDDLDEVDIEWLGSNPDEIQSNYFGKGQTTTYNRGQFHAVSGTQAKWIKYTVDWTKDRIVWMADGKVVRELKASEAEKNQYPQTPMQVKFGSWAGGDPNTNAPGTVQWARGPTDYSKGPFSMQVQSLVIADYSTGKQYKYKDTSGSWESIESVGGSVNGNANGNGNAITLTASASSPAVTTAFVSVPVGGIGKDGSPATATQTGWPWVASASPNEGSIPSGWYMTPNGKIMRSAAMSIHQSVTVAMVVSAPLTLGILTLFFRLW